MTPESKISEIVAEVALALKDAAAEYGPQAAELALMAYRVDAVKSLAFVPIAAASVYGIWRGWRWLWQASETWVSKVGTHYEDTTGRDLARAFGTLAGAATALVLSIAGMARLFDLPLWFAAFGKPELLIATRALQAAGLL